MTHREHALFLHGGPGFSARLERNRYGSELPIHWWDQPRIAASTRDAFRELIDAGVREVYALFERSNRPVSLIASSFGARLALELMREIPDRIAHVTICAGVLDLRKAFVRLGERVAEATGDSELRGTIRDAAGGSSRAAFWALIRRLGAERDLFRYYFTPAASQVHAEMCALAADGGLIDPATFESVADAVLDVPVVPLDRIPSKGVRVLLGRHDPYYRPEDVQLWTAHLPGAETQIVESGHFPHLELPAREWSTR